MAVVNVTSDMVTAREGGAAVGTYALPHDGPVARIVQVPFSVAQGSTAGDATSVQRLCYLPSGNIKVLGFVLKRSAFGASRVLDVGYEAYTNLAGTAVVASANAFYDDIDVSAAGIAFYPLVASFNSRSGICVSSVVAGGTIPALATLDGYFLVAV